jgi:hypothetical protein
MRKFEFFNTIGAIHAFSQRPLSRASRPFTVPILKGSNGSITLFRQALQQGLLFAPSGRPESTLRGYYQSKQVLDKALSSIANKKSSPLCTRLRPRKRGATVSEPSRKWEAGDVSSDPESVGE